MDNLRWILSGIGIVIIIGVYIWGRNRNKNNFSSPLDAANEVPSFSASDNDNDWTDGVGPVRVVSTDNVDAVISAFESTPVEDPPVKHAEPLAEDKAAENPAPTAQPPEAVEEETADPVSLDDVVALFIVAQAGQQLKGEQVLSATYATQLEYGDMKIFHRMDANNKIIFSMSNMQEPGWFDLEKMHEIKTRGISLFVQLSLCDDPVKSLDDMLLCAHTIASMLGGQLCDQNRQLLNESYTKGLRAKAKRIAEEKHQSQMNANNTNRYK